ncbi:malate dehydrogenase (NAD) /L-sulfolactate dehydrogenase [Streptomyces sp. TLI_053]|uniref:Ldh family oxidoreductase n=1 Tax=Streptomyces sp. TLI_053 TaxID=1855352 RepID=UPI00087D56D2|nr:Ldh family oxidoreductase [Streptomyces sp. TLI_053]SDT83420.1 malate dehydrogenase (NAD) /L-sulfolactate dehydrogenase [Streptomyces sp. TLI_053]
MTSHHPGPPPTGARPGSVRVALDDVRALMVAACRAARVPRDSIATVVEHYLAGELRGKSSHGIAKFCFESTLFSERQGVPRVVREHGALAVVDARREIGPLAARFAADLALTRARTFGAGIVGTLNAQRYGILADTAEHIAAAGMLAVVTNTSRPEATPGGGRTPVLGVNPLAYALPTLHGPASADMSTTLAPMGVLWEARRAGADLPDGCFVDADGTPTTDPDRAETAVIFGEHRGFVLSLLLQALTGSLFGFPMGSGVDSTWSTGYTVIALDPVGGHSDDAATANTRLLDEITRGRTRDDLPLRLPGQHSHQRRHNALREDALDLPAAVHRRLAARAAGDFTSD